MEKNNPSAYLDIFREFEAVKRTVYTVKENKFTMSIPRALLDEICEKHLNEDCKAVVLLLKRLILRFLELSQGSLERKILCCLGLFCSQKIHQPGRSFSNFILSSSLKRQKLAQLFFLMPV
jgi:hypothetical protein